MTTRAAEASPLIYARVAGFTFLFYIVVGITGLALPDQPGVSDVIYLLTAFSALVLAVTLYVITRARACTGPAGHDVSRRRSRIWRGRHLRHLFGVGSRLFCWLLLRGRMIPVALAWLGVLASDRLVVILPLQRAGLFGGLMSWSWLDSATWLVWLPMLVFEVALALWLMINSVAMPTPTVAPPRPDFVAWRKRTDTSVAGCGRE